MSTGPKKGGFVPLAEGEAAPQPTSLIATLHARYASVWAEHGRADCAATYAPPDGKVRLWLDRGMEGLLRESDALRLAMLYQVPQTMEEAALLSYHVWSIYDSVAALTADEKLALEAAVTALFDFLMRHGAADMNGHGEIFRAGTMLAWKSVRARTGEIDEIVA